MEESNQHGPWTIQRQREVYADPWVRVRRDEVLRPDGHPGSYCVVQIKPGVTVLAIDSQQRVYLTEEFHYGVGRVTIECVSGGVEPGESNQQAARRELKEELGIEAERLLSLGMVDPFTANVVSPTELFLAEGLVFGTPQTDGGEQIELRRMTLDEAVRAVVESQITHGPSAVAILKTQLRLSPPDVASEHSHL